MSIPTFAIISWNKLKAVLLFLVISTVILTDGLATIYPVMGLVACAILIVGIAIAIRVAIRPDLATLLVVFLLYSNIPVIAVNFHGVPFVVGAAYIGLLGIPLVSYLIVRSEKIIIPPAMPFILMFFAVQILGAFWVGADTLPALITFVLEGIVVYVLITNTVRSLSLLRSVIWALLLAGVVMSITPIYQQITKTYSNNYGGFGQTNEEGFETGETDSQGTGRQLRLAGTIGEQNRFAQVLVMLIPLGLFRFFGEGSKTLRFLAVGATAIIGLGIILTFSRGAAVSLLGLLFIMVWKRQIRPSYLFGTLALSFVLLLATPGFMTRMEKLADVSALFSAETRSSKDVDGAVRGRATAMLAAAMVFLDNPIIGVGPGRFPYYVQEYGNALNIRQLKENRRAHSMFLEIAAENGALGLIAFIGAIYITLRNLSLTYKLHRCDRPELANMAMCFWFVIVAYLLTALFLHLSYIRYYWLMMGLAASVTYIGTTIRRNEAFENSV